MVNFDPNYLIIGKTEWAKKTTQTCTIRRGEWNLPHKFHLYLIDKFDFLMEHLVNDQGALVVSGAVVGNHCLEAFEYILQ